MPFRYSIRYFKELPSTNSLALELAHKGEKEGLVLVADYQTDGRGKPGRKWFSPRGENLLFSVLLRPPIPPNRAPLLTQIACRSVASVLKRYGMEPSFKKPNDVMISGRKICGVLTEAQSTSGRRLLSVVIGIGLNVNSKARDLTPESTSMRECTGKELKREKILRELLTQLKKDIQDLYACPV